MVGIVLTSFYCFKIYGYVFIGRLFNDYMYRIMVATLVLSAIALDQIFDSVFAA